MIIAIWSSSHTNERNKKNLKKMGCIFYYLLRKIRPDVMGRILASDPPRHPGFNFLFLMFPLLYVELARV